MGRLSSAILFVLGASGAGKTAAVRCLEARGRPGIACFYFDSIGIPSDEVMRREYGGPERWQAEVTKQWIVRLASSRNDDSVKVLEGQTRPSFVRAAEKESGERVRMLLLDCSAEVRRVRLEARGHPELATPRMDTWAAYLRGQADALEIPVVATDELTVEEVADVLEMEADQARRA